MNNKIKLISLCTAVAFILSACADRLETNPTNNVSGTTIFEDAKSAELAIDGAYALLYRFAFNENTAHAFGLHSQWFAQDLMAEDAIANVANWYGIDYYLRYSKRIDINDYSRNHDIWERLYTVISNLNYIIAEEGNIGGDQNLATNVIAQAYALRSLCYFELIQAYQKTYLGNETAPGVPVYTEPTTAGMEGNPRGTVEDVYEVIVGDIEYAIELFEELNMPVQTHCSHIDYYVAKGIEARIALVQGRWQDAYDAAEIARSRSGVRLLRGEDEIYSGLSDFKLATSIWAMEQITDQVQGYGSIYAHLDPREGGHASNVRKCISVWLYNQVRTDDLRKEWWLDGNQGAAITGVNVNYGQMKRMAKNLTSWQGDIIYLRAEEMLLIQAEAAARLTQYTTARNLLKELGNVRYDDGGVSYATYVDALPDGSALSAAAIADTNTTPQNILEEVLLQRRIELWGEYGRIKDVLRLKQAYNRNYPGTNHSGEGLLPGVNTGAESGAFLFKIPQAELDGNINISPNDQNPTN